MRINNNVTAMNTHRMYTNNNANVTKSVAKLSSGYRINSAADDAAGLAISEKMRAQIRGLSMASKNSADAQSMVQTAEGALQETHNILQRMRELAVQSSSDTNETSIDRAALQQEYQNLLDEINEISTTTRFNDQNLLDGTFQKIHNTTNTAKTTLSNVNALSVARSSAGEYTMSVASTEASASIITPGAACDVLSTDMDAMAAKAEKVASIAFQGLETGAHDGNTYTLKVSGSDIKNMTFQLLDSNGDIVSTAQNVNTSEWKAIEYEADGTTVKAANNSGNVVSFKGVGTLTFTLDEAVSTVTDLDTLSGATMTFASTGTKFQHTTTLANVDDMADIKGALNTAFGVSGQFTAKYEAGTTTEVTALTANETDVPDDVTFSYALAKDGKMTVSMMQGTTVLGTDTKDLTTLDGGTTTAVEFDFGEYGKVTVGNTNAVALPTVYTHGITLADADLGAIGTAMNSDLGGDATLTVTHTANPAGEFTYKSTNAAVGAADFEYSFSQDGDEVTLTIKSKTDPSVSVTNTVTLVQNDAVNLDMGIFGKFNISASDDDVTDSVSAQNPAVGLDLTSADTVVSDKSNEVGAAAIAATDATNTFSPAASPIEVETTGGKAQEATPAVRASMTLTINGESVVLHKGDTYANFADQGISFSFDALSDEDILNAEYFGELTDGSVTIAVNGTDGKALVIQSGANEGDELAINIDRISTETLGLSYSNISTHASASRAITEVNSAINQVSTQRATLGALSNRLDHKIANLDTSAENLQAAESRIRDVDMAKEMTNFTKNNILAQASTAMLAQANALPQGVLQLLG